MFFAKDLLAVKTSPFNRIWLLAHKDEKFKAADLKLATVKIADSLLKWIKAQDARRTSLPLSTDLALGLSRALYHQSLALHKDILALKTEFRKSAKSAQTQIDAIDLERPSIITAAPDFENSGLQVRLDEITLREVPIDLPADPTPVDRPVDRDDFFGDEG